MSGAGAIPILQRQRNLSMGQSADVIINADRVWARHMELATIGATDGGGVHRLALSDLDIEAHRLLARWAGEHNYSVELDAIGNMFIRRPGMPIRRRLRWQADRTPIPNHSAAASMVHSVFLLLSRPSRPWMMPGYQRIDQSTLRSGTTRRVPGSCRACLDLPCMSGRRTSTKCSTAPMPKA